LDVFLGKTSINFIAVLTLDFNHLFLLVKVSFLSHDLHLNRYFWRWKEDQVMKLDLLDDLEKINVHWSSFSFVLLTYKDQQRYIPKLIINLDFEVD